MKAAFTWTDEALASVADLCVRRWGIRVREGDSPRLRLLSESAYLGSADESFPGFVARLSSLDDDDPEMQAFIAQLVVGETSFFRDQPQFNALRESVLPAIAADRRREGRLQLRVWSAGCASGEEPYSVAMLIAETIPDWRDWDIRILGTDINPFALRRARLARFGDWSFRGVEDESIRGYFLPVGARTRYLQHPCRELVKFDRHNLATDSLPDPERGLAGLDVILCRNVTIYFDLALTRRLADGFLEALGPGGWLFVGHAEPDPQVFGRFEPVEFKEALVYRAPGNTVKHPAPSRDVRSAGSGRQSPTPSVARRHSGQDHSPTSRAVEDHAEIRLPTLAEARVAYDAHDHAGASALLVAIANGGGSDPTAAHLLAQLSADEKHYDEALYWAFRALLLDRFHSPTMMLMGLIWLERGYLPRAREQLQHAIFNNPRAPEAHFYLSMVHRALENPDQSERSRERALRLARAHGGNLLESDLLPVERPRIGLAKEALAKSPPLE